MHKRRIRKGERGAALVEFALAAMPMFLLVTGGLIVGSYVFASHALAEATHFATRSEVLEAQMEGRFPSAANIHNIISDRLQGYLAGVCSGDRLVVHGDVEVHSEKTEAYVVEVICAFQNIPPDDQAKVPFDKLNSIRVRAAQPIFTTS